MENSSLGLYFLKLIGFLFLFFFLEKKISIAWGGPC